MLGFFSLPYSANYINRANLEGKLFLVKVFSLDIYEGECPLFKSTGGIKCVIHNPPVPDLPSKV